MSSLSFNSVLPLSLYIHYPWCIEKCPYCDFNSHTLKQNLDEQAYLDALILQLQSHLPMIWGRPIRSIFFGGGTPSLISQAGLEWLMSQLRALLNISPTIEITLEANPGTVDFEKFSGFHNAGINRLSMGIQSFNDKKLKSLGRIHSSYEAKIAIERAHQAGFKNFNLDLMFALPNQTVHEAITDIDTALEFTPPHLSHYQLTLEPNTPFFKQPPPLPDDDLAWEMQEQCQLRLQQAGYHHYEVSAFAQERHKCQHNLNYWEFGDYLGLGAGAHGKITIAPEGRVLRTQMPASPGGYVNDSKMQKFGRQYEVDAEELSFEFMLNALRLQQGFDLTLYEQHTGLSLETIKPRLEHLQTQNLIRIDKQQLGLTKRGQIYLNDVISSFLQQ